MSSVTRLHLLSQSMLNVSCQKQKPCSSLPTDSLMESPMEFVGQPKPSGACSLLVVPGLSTLDLDVDEDEGEVVIGIRPKSSPLPRRRSSVFDEDSESEPPMCGSRRVSFADAKGLSLVQVKEFDTWDVPKLPGYDSSQSEGKDAEEYFLSPLTFSAPLSTEELFVKVREQKVELETIELLPGTTILRGVIRVLNISFLKAVYVRTTLDTWSSHFDLLAEYIPSSSDSATDCFSFKLTLVPPFGEQGARVDFCLRYETPVGTFWANNNNRNYVLLCHQRVKERKDEPQRENVNKKSCLRTVGQNFSSVENISAMEDSSQEAISTDKSKHGEKVDTMKTKQISDGQTGTSEDDGQKLQDESRQNCSRRRRRKAARMARVRDLFAQRDGGPHDAERDGSPPEAKQVAEEETPEEQHSDVQSFSEGSSKSDASLFLSESLATSSEPILHVLHDLSPAHDCISKSEPETFESVNLADLTTLAGAESATDIADSPLHSNDAPTEHQNINKSVSKAEESTQKEGTSSECTSNDAAEPADRVISAVSSESLVSKTSSFTFGTVVAPLYHQVFGRVGSESQNIGDWGNPARAALNVGNLTQNYPRSERIETGCSVQTDARSNDDKVQGNVIKTQESKQECLDVAPPIEEDETSFSVTANGMDHAEAVQETKPSDQSPTVAHPHSLSMFNTDLSNSQIPPESLHLGGEAQEDDLTHDLHSQTTAETAQAPLPALACTQIETNPDESCAQSETEKVVNSQEISFMSLNCQCADESNKDDGVLETVTASMNNGISEEGKLLEALHDLNPDSINNSASKEIEDSCDSCFEILEKMDVTTLQITHGEAHDGEEETKEPMMSSYHIHGDALTELKHEDTLKYDEMNVSERAEHHEMEAAVSTQAEFCLADAAEAKNWEMMVEEEEENIVTDEEQSEAIRSKVKDIEAVEKDQGGQLADAGIETASENRDTPEDEIVGHITAAKEEDNKAEDADALEDKQRTREGHIREIVAGKDRDKVEKELEYVEDTKTEKTAGVEGLGEDTEVEKREEHEEVELEKKRHFAEIQEVTTERVNVKEEEEIEEEEMEIDLNDGGEASVEWEDQVRPSEENVKEENPDYKEEILVDQTGESEIVDAESESMTTGDGENEVEYFEERLDFTQNKVEDGLSAPVSNVQDKRGADQENTAEGQNAHIPAQMHLYEEGGFQSGENVSHDPSKAARDESEPAAAEGGSCIFTDEPESDQQSHDSASEESNSDDEVELYMHCLRAVHAGTQAQRDRNTDTGFSAGKRPSVSRSKLLSTPMPSISESLDEEPNLNHLQDSHEDMETADFQPIAAALPVSSGQESNNRKVSWWMENFTSSNISKTVLYATLFVVFVVVASHYDFLACFGLYLISVIWLCCQGERQPVKNNRMG
ncbi:uncharacterized protein ppp1r3ab [Chaetodon trifascialis]|uniref:uncharacterized protein ppp1r3ab n=1 Tax=Chaetodon trifascialis TaxID=109706 RepID=UPI0039926DBF